MKTLEQDPEIIEFIEKNISEYLDSEMAYKIYAAIGEVVVDKNTRKGDTKKSFTSLACAVAIFLYMLTRNLKKPHPNPCSELAKIFSDHLVYFSETLELADDTELPN